VYGPTHKKTSETAEIGQKLQLIQLWEFYTGRPV